METLEMALDSMAKEITISLDNNEVISDEKNKKQIKEDRMYELSNKVSLSAEIWSMSELIDKLEIQEPLLIDLSPSYQRMDVWPDLKRKEFLNNLFKKCPINDIILGLYEIDEQGNKIYRVIDGKQRLTSIYKFIKNEIKIDTSDSREEWRNKDYTTLRGNISTRNMFSDIKIHVKIYDTFTNLTEEEGLAWESWAFTEMNSSMALNNIEKRNAQHNDLNATLTGIYQSLNPRDRIYTKSTSDKDRYKNKEMIEKVFYQTINKDFFSRKMTAANMMKFQENFDDSDIIDEVKQKFNLIHKCIINNENHQKYYWKNEFKNGTRTYKKSGIASPLNNLDLLVYGMALLENDSYENIKYKFDDLVSTFYYYIDLYRANKLTDPTHKVEVDKFIQANLRGTGQSGNVRKEYLDFLFKNLRPRPQQIVLE